MSSQARSAASSKSGALAGRTCQLQLDSHIHLRACNKTLSQVRSGLKSGSPFFGQVHEVGLYETG